MSKLSQTDPVLHALIVEEAERQSVSIELIASENFTSPEVLECLGSILTNKYSEGLPGARYYGGNHVIDKIENLCINRALTAFRLNDAEWGVNVQPYSGSVANLAAYNGILEPGDRLMGLDLPSGGHLTHGYQTAKKKISVSAIFYESQGYHVGPDGYIDYDRLEEQAREFQPKLIICGASAYPRDYDYSRFRKIADACGSYLLCDMAHFSGLVAAGEHNNPFDYCDIVTTTTHKTLRGPRAGMIFFKKELAAQINFSVFPSVQGGPHEHQIAGVATQLLEVATPEFKSYIAQVKKNARVLADEMTRHGYHVCSGGTDNHLVLVSFRDKGVTGSKIEKVCELVDISINKNSVYGDKSALSPGGIRVGTPAMTTRGFNEEHFTVVADLLHQCVQLALRVQAEVGKKLVNFNRALVEEHSEELEEIKQQVHELTNGLSHKLYE